jgi:hypothetical protein
MRRGPSSGPNRKYQTRGNYESRSKFLMIDFAPVAAYFVAWVSGSHVSEPPASGRIEAAGVWPLHESRRPDSAEYPPRQ